MENEFTESPFTLRELEILRKLVAGLPVGSSHNVDLFNKIQQLYIEERKKSDGKYIC